MKNNKSRFLCHECQKQYCEHRDPMTEEEKVLGSADYCDYGFERIQANNVKKYLVNIIDNCEKQLKQHVKVLYKSSIIKGMYIIETPLEAEELLELFFMKDIELDYHGALC